MDTLIIDILPKKEERVYNFDHYCGQPFSLTVALFCFDVPNWQFNDVIREIMRIDRMNH